MTQPAPILWVFAGPNGAGKTTLFNETLRGQVPYVNADEIAFAMDPAYNGNKLLEAGKIAIQQRKDMIEAQQSFSIETTLSGNSAIAFMKTAKESGYHISLAYVGLDSPELSRTRVDERVADGGHDVPTDAVIRRHPDSMRRLASAMEIADSTMVFDNSGLERRLLLQVEQGTAKYINNDKPHWLTAAVPESMRRFQNGGIAPAIQKRNVQSPAL